MVPACLPEGWEAELSVNCNPHWPNATPELANFLALSSHVGAWADQGPPRFWDVKGNQKMKLCDPQVVSLSGMHPA